MKKATNGILLFAILAAAILFYVLDPAKHAVFPKCLLYSASGFYCPGCGSQRALHSLLHFDLAAVVRYNVLFLPAALLVLYHYLHPLVNRVLRLKLPNILYLKNTPWVILAVVLMFWIARNLPSFSELAPQ